MNQILPYWKIKGWKSRLLKQLDEGTLNNQEWERFIQAANASNCEAMATDMRKRLEHYAEVA